MNPQFSESPQEPATASNGWLARGLNPYLPASPSAARTGDAPAMAAPTKSPARALQSRLREWLRAA